MNLEERIYCAIAHGLSDVETNRNITSSIQLATENVLTEIKRGCVCDPDETTGDISIQCCNICGLPTEKPFKQNPPYASGFLNGVFVGYD